MTRWLVFLGVGLIAASAGLYLAEDTGVVTIDHPYREMALACGATHTESFAIHNPTRRVIRVVGLGVC